MRLSATGDETAPGSRQLDGCWYILDDGNAAASSAGSSPDRAVVDSRDWPETGPVTATLPRLDVLGAIWRRPAKPPQGQVDEWSAESWWRRGGWLVG
jgi:hypothetical protein